MNLSIKNKINLKPALQKIQSNEFWLFSAQEWKRLISPYVPRRSGQLMQNVEVKPNKIIYKSIFSAYVYFGKLYVDPKYIVGGFTKDGVTWWSRPGIKKKPTNTNLKYRRDINPKASKEWDKTAVKDKQDILLAQSMQRWIERNL